MGNLARFALTIGAAALFAGCGAQGGGTLPQGFAARNKVHKASGSYGDLLYISTTSGVAIVSWPQLQIVGSFENIGFANLCSDPNTGNVFAPTGNEVLEYTHGGTTPIAILYPPTGYSDLQGCAVDPTTGNLALKSYWGPKGHNALLIFPGGQGTPIVYDGDKYFYLSFAYDDAGNLFSPVLYGHHGKEGMVELPQGESTFTFIRTPPDLDIGKIQWDGKYLVCDVRHVRQGATMYQLSITSNKTSISGTVHLQKAGRSLFWIHNGTVFQLYWKVIHNKNAAIAAWPYPQGGKPTALLYGVSKGKHAGIGDITYSVAPGR